MWVPPGFAHGFVVTADAALFVYKCTEYYRPESELAVRWDDSRVGVAWPVAAPAVSAKDEAGRPLSAFSAAELPRYVAERA
jgi:dTDP-4-dehydrorhamnose 3,5-epimerase